MSANCDWASCCLEDLLSARTRGGNGAASWPGQTDDSGTGPFLRRSGEAIREI